MFAFVVAFWSHCVAFWKEVSAPDFWDHPETPYVPVVVYS